MAKTKTFQFDIRRDCAQLEKDMTFATLFSITCAHSGIDAAMWLEGDEIKTLSYDRQRQLADNYAAALGEFFGTKGRICICLDSCKEWFPVFWGLIRSGHDVLLAAPQSTDEQLKVLMGHSACIGIVSASERAIECPQITLAKLAASPQVNDYEPVWAQNVALCTSGTTAESRIFVYNEDSICHMAICSLDVYNRNRQLIDDRGFRSLAFLPFHHVLGFSAIFVWSHFLGFTIAYVKDRAPQAIVTTCQKCGVNQVITVPLLANNLCRSFKTEIYNRSKTLSAGVDLLEWLSLTLQSVFPRLGMKFAKLIFGGFQKKLLGKEITCIILGGSRTSYRSLRHLNALGYYTICGFGMTETAINSLETRFFLDHRLRGGIGQPLDDTQYRIKGGTVANGMRGELQIRGGAIHDGRMLDGKMLPAEVDAEGWFSTGDVARLNRLTREYFIVGRIKDVIINESGENVYPDELEDSFGGLKGVEQLCIIGTRAKGTRYEAITLAMCVGSRIDDSEYLADLEARVAKINKGLPVYKRLARAFVAKDKFPVTNTQKVKRIALKELVKSESISFRELNLATKNSGSKTNASADEKVAARAKVRDEIKEQVAKIYSEVLGKPAGKIDPDANFIEDMGGDSLQVLSIVSKAEETFNIMIPAEEYVNCATINDAARIIERLVYGEADSSQSNRLVERAPITRFEDTEEYKHFQHRLEGMLHGGAKNPYFVCHDSPLLDTSVVDGREMLDFGSYNYVGMSGRKEVSDAAKTAIDRWGTSASGSRLLAGEKPIHGELEREIAEWKHAEKALVCVGGHSTNVTVVGNFCGKNDLILYDALAHNSVEQGCRLSDAVARPFPHNDLAALEHILQTQRKYFEKVLIVIEGVYSMDGDISPVPEFVTLKKKYGCFLMVDEAHSACVLGPTGGGVDEYFGLEHDDIDIKMGTLSKGLGTCGGYLAGRACVIDYLRYSLPGFVFSVGISPALAAGSLEAIRLLRTRPEIMEGLHRNIECFAGEAKKYKLDICGGGKAAVIPIMVGTDEAAFALSNEMENRGILVPPAVYPAVPKGKARLRFDVISEHKPEQIIKAIETLVQAAKDLGITLPTREY